ncbi:MAG: bifunctional diaminohydroxyphosphoribosylaminopyrimidine deaminase/5-amino-6-(5-phosphoribosylamino)uracil reductase RibD [Thermoanaerobaculia bacterium]
MTEAAPLELLWRRVFELAARGRFSTSPNPRVGAVLVDAEGTVVGEGAHERAGGPHAEAVALAAAGARARGATMLINLEPCSHFGRTPPCTEALLAAGVSRVVCSIEDPDPRTAGRGIRRLRERGVDVLVGAFADEAETLNEAFLKSIRDRRPFVHLKWAASMDGRIATRTGDSKWITGESAREDALLLREECDAILVGAGTVLMDDPLLTRRLALSSAITPHRRLVLDGALRVPATARVFSAAGGEVWLATAVPAGDPRLAPFHERGVQVFSRPAARGGVDLGALLGALHALDVRSLLVEGGGITAASFLSAGLVDRVTAYVAPLLVGGAGAPSPLAGEGPARLADAHRLGGLEAVRVGPDVRLSARILPPVVG